MTQRPRPCPARREHLRRCPAGVAVVWIGLVLAVGSAPGKAGAHPGDRTQIGVVDSLLAARPGDPELLLRRAELLRLAGDGDAAARELAQLLAVAPDDARVRLVRARLRLDRDSAAAALLDAEAFAIRAPADPAGWLLAARASARLGRHRRAAAAYDRAIALMPAPRPAHYLARARACEAAGAPERAIAGLDEARERLGPIVVLEREAMRIEADLGRYDAALERLDRMALRFERPIVPLVERGDLLARAGRLPAALAAWTAALESLEAEPASNAADEALIALLHGRLRGMAGRIGSTP